MSDIVTGLIKLRDGGERQVQLRRGTTDATTFQMIFKRKDYDIGRLRRGKELQRVYERMIAGGTTPFILDCGANVGLAALYFDIRYPGSRIVAIEPAADNVELLRRNCEGCENIHIEAAAIASAPGFARIVDETTYKDAYRTELIAEDEGGVPAVTVAQLFERYAGDGAVAPFIAKIDIEGAESELFSQNTDWVARFPLIIVELHDWLIPGQANSRNFLRCIAAQDRDFVWFEENAFSIRNGPKGAG